MEDERLFGRAEEDDSNRRTRKLRLGAQAERAWTLFCKSDPYIGFQHFSLHPKMGGVHSVIFLHATIPSDRYAELFDYLAILKAGRGWIS